MNLLIPPPVVTLVSAILIWVLANYLPIGMFEIPQQKFVAYALIAVGLGIDVISVLLFYKKRTTITPLSPDKTSDLVSEGFYRYSRNPMYLGMAIVLVGWAIYCGTALGILGIVFFVIYITRFQILPEEQILRQKFGADFDEYCKTVRRWI